MAARAGLRVALVFGTFPPERNGGADFLAHFAAALGAAGAGVHVVTSPHAGSPERELAADGVTVHRIVDDWTLSGTGRDAGTLRRVLDLLTAERVDVVHVFFPDSVVQERYRLPAGLAGGRPLVTTFWNLGLGRRSPTRIRLTALWLLARSSVLTSHDPRYLRALRVAGRGPAHWLPVGSNLDAPTGAARGEVRARLGPDVDDPLLGYFGHLDFTRGVEDLFQAVAALRRVRPVRLLMIGAAGEREPAFRALADELGIADATHWTGYLPAPEVADALAAVDLCVLPYRRNSLGRSALAAALELGVPTVLGGTPEGIAPLQADTHVALVPPGDSAALTATLGGLLDDDAARARLATGARRAAGLFAWPRIAATALGLYREAIRRNG